MPHFKLTYTVDKSPILIRIKSPMHLSLSIDSNGNKILKVQIGHARGFSVQTNGNLPITHFKGINQFTILELTNHLNAFGTPRQRELIQQTTVI